MSWPCKRPVCAKHRYVNEQHAHRSRFARQRAWWSSMDHRLHAWRKCVNFWPDSRPGPESETSERDMVSSLNFENRNFPADFFSTFIPLLHPSSSRGHTHTAPRLPARHTRPRRPPSPVLARPRTSNSLAVITHSRHVTPRRIENMEGAVLPAYEERPAFACREWRGD